MARLWDTEPELIPFCSREEAQMVKEGLFADQAAILLPKLRERLDAWRAQLPKPTREQMLQVTHEENRMHARLNGGNEQFWDGLEADWRRKQKPDFVPVQADDRWSPVGREWLESERRAGTIYRDFEHAKNVYQARSNEEFPDIQRPQDKPPELPDDLREMLGIPRTVKEKRDAELLKFMPKQLRAEYDKADEKRKAALWKANERNFEDAREREEQRLRQYQDKTEKTLDMLHRIKEDSTKAHLLPPDDASMDELHKWHDKMSQPVRLIPFPGEGGYLQGEKQNQDTSGSPFDLSRFDPSTLDLSHLHPFERDRVLRREFYPQEIALLLDRKNPWTESGKPKPLPAQPPKSIEVPQILEDKSAPEKPKRSEVRKVPVSEGSNEPSEIPDFGRDLFGDAVRANREHRHLQKREELLEREEQLQRQRGGEQIEAYSIANEPFRAQRLANEDDAKAAQRQHKFDPNFLRRACTEIAKHRGWYIFAFIAWGLPVGVAAIWPMLVRDETLQEWLAANGWPRLTTLVMGWLAGLCVIALVIVARSSMKAYAPITQMPDVTPYEPDGRLDAIVINEVRSEWNKLTDDQKRLLKRILISGGLNWNQIDVQYWKALPIYADWQLSDYLLERSTLLEHRSKGNADLRRYIESKKTGKVDLLLGVRTWKVKPSFKTALEHVIRAED